MEFTKEEISLCKLVVEKHRKKIIFGVWFHDAEDPGHLPFLWCNLTDELKRKSAVPLWTISDCLEFLIEKGLNHRLNFMCYPSGNWRITAEDRKYRLVMGEGETRLAACLLAVLVVFEREK